MIDIESAVFGKVATEIRSKYKAAVSGEEVDRPASFPAVTIVEKSNTVHLASRTNVENAANVMFEVSVYTNSVGYKKSEAKAIMATVDDVFSELGFTRIMCNPVTNLQEATIYRIVARYEAVVDKDFWIYKN